MYTPRDVLWFSLCGNVCSWVQLFHYCVGTFYAHPINAEMGIHMHAWIILPSPTKCRDLYDTVGYDGQRNLF